MRATHAYAYDVVLPVEPSVYEITVDAKGQAFGFDFSDAREQVEQTARSVLSRPQDIEQLEFEPGYLWVRVKPHNPLEPSELIEGLRSIPDTYNDRHATDPGLDGLAFDQDGIYIGTTTPEDMPDRESWLESWAPANAPEHEGPVFSYDRPDAGESVLGAQRRFAYEFTLPFDPSMYESSQAIGGRGEDPVRWGPEAITEALETTVEEIPAWPKSAENTPSIVIHPTHTTVRFYTGSYKDAVYFADRIKQGILRYNRYRPVDEDRSDVHTKRYHKPLKFLERVHIGAVHHGQTAEGYIEAHGLDAIEGEPFDPENTDGEKDVRTWDSLNPLS